MKDKSYFQILVPSLMGLLMVIFSTGKDLFTYFTIILGLIIIILISINVMYFPRLGLMKFQIKEKIPTIYLLWILLAITGVIIGRFQPIAWLNFFPFGYYIFLSFLLIFILERVLKLKIKD